jgi:hypothetical protein
MKRARFGTLAMGLLTVGGLGLTLACSASAAPAQQAARTASSATSPVRMVAFDCPAQPALTRPRTFILACADANAYLGKLSWTSWTTHLATGYGVLE